MIVRFEFGVIDNRDNREQRRKLHIALRPNILIHTFVLLAQTIYTC